MMYEKDCSFICFISNSWCKYLLGLYWKLHFRHLLKLQYLLVEVLTSFLF